jgi:acyl carrier protein
MTAQLSVDQLAQTVRTVVEAVLGTTLPPGDVPREDVEQWDSLAHVEVLFGVEEEIGVVLPGDQLEKIDSLATLITAVEAARR